MCFSCSSSTPYFGKIRLLEGSVSVPLSPGVIITITNALICNDLKSKEELTTEGDYNLCMWVECQVSISGLTLQ